MYPPALPQAHAAVPTQAPDAPTAPAGDGGAQKAIKWRGRVESCLKQRENKVKGWKDNVLARIGKMFDVEPDEDTVNVAADWARTKNKQAQLFFQVPAIAARPLQPSYGPAAPIAAASLNWMLTHEVKAYRMMDEVLADAINAAGIGICKIGYDATFEQVKTPSVDTSMMNLQPGQLEQGMQSGTIPSQDVPRTLSECYYATRIAPQNFLWAIDFTGSDFQECPWIGSEGWKPKAEAIRLKWVDESFTSGASSPEYLTDDQKDRKTDDEYVHYFEIFYKAGIYDANEQNYDKIKRLVLVDGKDIPAVDEDFKWQKFNPQTRRWVGLRTYPIKVLTLTYVSDMCIPPSDSHMGRPQVQEQIVSRSQMLKQRRHSLPVRWFDVNFVDDDVADQLRKGVWQDFLPMNGPGDRAIGEVARASYPRENFQFMDIIQHDLDEVWSSGNNQSGTQAQGSQSATEANIVQTNASLRLDYERAKTLRFFQEVAEGIFSLMQLFQDDQRWAEIAGPQGGQALQAWDRNAIAGEFVFEISPDAGQKVDIGRRRDDFQKTYNLVRQDPMVNAQPILREWMTLMGLDPSQVVVQPQKPPEPPNVSYRFSGPDLLNPFVVAIMQKTGTVITQQDITNAKQLIIDSSGEALPPAPPPMPGAPTGPPAGQPPPPTAHPGTPPMQSPITKRYPDGASAV